MESRTLHIEGQSFVLADGQDLAALKSAIADAAARGPRFVDFTAIGHGAVSLLMTSRLSVRLEVQEPVEGELWAEDGYPVDHAIDLDLGWELRA